jgi:hypothetical protein
LATGCLVLGKAMDWVCRYGGAPWCRGEGLIGGFSCWQSGLGCVIELVSGLIEDGDCRRDVGRLMGGEHRFGMVAGWIWPC